LGVAVARAGPTLALCDLCGTSLPPGICTTPLVGLPAAHTADTSAPEALAARVNRDLCRMEPLAPLASMFLAKLDPINGIVRYCSAGHPPAFLLRRNGELEKLSAADCCSA